VHRMVVSTAGFLFASVGFSLSVLAVLFALFISVFFADSTKPPASVAGMLEKRRARQFPISVRHSEISSTSSLAPTPKHQGKAPNVTVVANHDCIRSSPSPPPPPPPPTRHTKDNLLPSLTRKPTTVTFVQDLHTTSLPTSSSRTVNAMSPERILIPPEFEEGRLGFKFSNLKPLWGEKRPKQQLYRVLSSPHLTTNPPLPVQARGEPPKHSALGKKRSKPLRPEAGNTSTARSVSCPTVVAAENKRVEKKKSQTLRTQPYEAPYFFPPPVPPIPNTEAVNRRNPSRSRTLPLRHKSASPSRGHG